MFLRLLLDSFVRRRSRKLLAVGAIWIGNTLVVALFALSMSVHDKMGLELQAFGSNIKVEPVDASITVRFGGHDVVPERSAVYLSESDLSVLGTIFWRNNILAISPRLLSRVQANGSEAPLLGVRFDHPVATEGRAPLVTGVKHVSSHWKVDGSWPDSGPESGRSCMVGVDLARKLGVTGGDVLEVTTRRGSATLGITGVISSGDREDGMVIAPLAVAQRLAGAAGKISDVEVSALTTPENKLTEKYNKDPKSLTPAEYEQWICTPYPGSVAMDIQKAIPGSVARVVRRVSETQGSVLLRMEGLMLILAGITLVVTGLSVAGVLASAVIERRPEVALMQAIGAHRSDVRLLLLSEAGILGLVSGLLAAPSGLLLGGWLVRTLFGSEAGGQAPLILLSILLGPLIALMGSLWPVWTASNRNTAEALYET